MSEMVERVALAIATRIHLSAMRHSLREINQEDQFEDWLKAYPVKVTADERELARAAIEAMREPTDAMLDAAATVDHGAQPGEEWEPMIDAALGRVDA